ncbi:DUF2087 domain-containing protein [Brevibacterium sp. S111]|uniref:DUF2087 domain-containing protein n=1 Tax=Brevibacterium sp. S111 TaxID=2483795 RepID=UPI00108008B7|nr:DUF2087 domain-containing protein [Brevibacterium sp. S111]TGD12537.1 DUF2087 domain-containing protein [Brevibacterium sp. S111]
MTKDKDFKKLVRSRMTETGENFTTARQTLLDSANSATNPAVPNAAEAIDQSVLRFRTKTLKTFMSSGRITAIPTKRRALNEHLADFHPDFALLRRELIDYRLLERNPHTGRYWVNPNPSTPTGPQAQEMAGFEAFLR